MDNKLPSRFQIGDTVYVKGISYPFSVHQVSFAEGKVSYGLRKTDGTEVAWDDLTPSDDVDDRPWPSEAA